MNVMITDDGRACLSDIGLNICLRHAIYRDRWLVPSSWMFKPPEELVTQDDTSSFKPTKAMDVYAFASTAYSVSHISRPSYISLDMDRFSLSCRYSPRSLRSPGSHTGVFGRLWPAVTNSTNRQRSRIHCGSFYISVGLLSPKTVLP